ncbi:pyrroloquinoline quinone biosynthesis peptide chaperone PqqD [Luteibacter aegosomatis]|uniref:pyrroloquinoline quinone biosynthesis peptide chaperone PqqD n=1 Tax=Luteibacter aegosomatis TaxID=2911537 RepID=UPI001FFA62AC|nr:pyrroloquinoline quinone biosynthesis peptide chaperone PqqD [Luteibacter aegosomatis]UPG84578.1 pyrroloquinoline quinone biosynthesis peptide chaperone PqqD [Luteibacter aegosomatis]
MSRGRIPQWRPGYRFQWEPAQDAFVLLYPEGMVRLNESAGMIGELIDGKRSVEAIVVALAAEFTDADSEEIGADVDGFMQVAHEKHWLRFD